MAVPVLDDPDDLGSFRVIFRNKSAIEISRVPDELILGKTLRESVPEFLETEAPASWKKALDTGRTQTMPSLRYGDEVVPEAVWSVLAIPIDAKTVAVCFEDITRRQAAEEALQRVHDELEQRVESRTSELRSTNQQLEVEIAERTRIEEELKNNTEQYRLITDAMPALIAYVDADQRYQFANRGYEDWFGLALGDIRGKHVRDVLGDAGFEALVEHVERALKGQPQFFEAVIADKEGNDRNVEARYVPHFDADHKVLGYFVLAVDISERKRAEEERRTIDRKLQEIQKLESLGLLAGVVAHDFNNLLTGILGNASLSRMDLPKGSVVLSYLDDIETTSRHAADLCKQMLAYSGRGRFVIQNLSLSDLIGDMDHLLRLSISKKAVLRLDLQDDLPPVKADASQIRQIVLNLVINASEAIGDQSGLIVVATGMVRADRQYLETAALSPDIAPGDYLFVEVSDNGCGMDAEAKQRIFDPFYTTKFTGRGLGLAAVLGIVRGHTGGLEGTL